MFTHNFEIKIDGIEITGEIYFNHGEEVKFKTNQGEELTLSQHAKVQRLFELFTDMSKCCEQEIEKIELVRK